MTPERTVALDDVLTEPTQPLVPIKLRVRRTLLRQRVRFNPWVAVIGFVLVEIGLVIMFTHKYIIHLIEWWAGR